MALDVGTRRIGLAVSDPLGWTAQGLETLERTNIREDMARLRTLASQFAVARIVVGNPVHMSGDESRQGRYVRGFGDRLGKETGLPVEYWDERLTSVEAGRLLRQGGVNLRRDKGKRDRLSAVLLLENYLAARLQP